MFCDNTWAYFPVILFSHPPAVSALGRLVATGGHSVVVLVISAGLPHHYWSSSEYYVHYSIMSGLHYFLHIGDFKVALGPWVPLFPYSPRPPVCAVAAHMPFVTRAVIGVDVDVTARRVLTYVVLRNY